MKNLKASICHKIWKGFKVNNAYIIGPISESEDLQESSIYSEGVPRPSLDFGSPI